MEEHKLTAEIKSEIDSMSHYEMCRIWRFAQPGSRLTSGETGDYFSNRQPNASIWSNSSRNDEHRAVFFGKLSSVS